MDAGGSNERKDHFRRTHEYFRRSAIMFSKLSTKVGGPHVLILAIILLCTIIVIIPICMVDRTLCRQLTLGVFGDDKDGSKGAGPDNQVCGDGFRADAESCDDGNTLSLDGCSSDCGIEAGYTCSGGTPSSSDTCVACDPACRTCSGQGSKDCLSCPASGTPFFDAGTCLASCPADKYADVSDGNVCKPCHAACGKCNGPSSSDCLSCTPTSAGTTPYLHDWACVAECPSGTHPGTSESVDGSVPACLSCDSTCETCSGPSSKECLSCPASGTPFLEEGSCVTQCTSGKYADENNECVKCHITCKGCSGPGDTACTACDDSATFDAGTCIYPVGTCPDGQFLDADNQTCKDCTPEFNCKTCKDATECETCPTEAPFLHGKTCVDVCPDGTWQNNDYCDACDSTCKVCDGSGLNQCTACPDGEFLHVDNSCLSACPDAHFASGSTCVRTCPNLHHNKTCVDTCPDEASFLHKDDNSCLSACPDEAPFLDEDDNSCLSACPDLHHNATCVETCPGTYVRSGSTCVLPGSYVYQTCPGTQSGSTCVVPGGWTYETARHANYNWDRDKKCKTIGRLTKVCGEAPDDIDDCWDKDDKPPCDGMDPTTDSCHYNKELRVFNNEIWSCAQDMNDCYLTEQQDKVKDRFTDPSQDADKCCFGWKLKNNMYKCF